MNANISVTEAKSINEVRYWLKENNFNMSDDNIQKVATKALHLFNDKGYSSLENAVEDILTEDKTKLKMLIPCEKN